VVPQGPVNQRKGGLSKQTTVGGGEFGLHGTSAAGAKNVKKAKRVIVWSKRTGGKRYQTLLLWYSICGTKSKTNQTSKK